MPKLKLDLLDSLPELLTVGEISTAIRKDRHAVTDMFVREPEVLVLGRAETVRGKRRYRQLRIPKHVFARVCARKMVR